MSYIVFVYGFIFCNGRAFALEYNASTSKVRGQKSHVAASRRLAWRARPPTAGKSQDNQPAVASSGLRPEGGAGKKNPPARFLPREGTVRSGSRKATPGQARSSLAHLVQRGGERTWRRRGSSRGTAASLGDRDFPSFKRGCGGLRPSRGSWLLHSLPHWPLPAPPSCYPRDPPTLRLQSPLPVPPQYFKPTGLGIKGRGGGKNRKNGGSCASAESPLCADGEGKDERRGGGAYEAGPLGHRIWGSAFLSRFSRKG